MVDIKEKRAFIEWAVTNLLFPKRDVYWILNYLAEHETILENTKFVEQIEQTPRGIGINVDFDANLGAPLTLYLKGHVFYDANQIFHEIRLNWRMPLYIEFHFPNAGLPLEYIKVLEDNPFGEWRAEPSCAVKQQVDAALEKWQEERETAFLYRQIDQALDRKDAAKFKELSAALHEKLVSRSQSRKVEMIKERFF